jgi:cytochrome c oxidase subunit II
MPQYAAGLTFLAGTVVLALALVWVAARARRAPAPVDEVTPPAYRIRRGWFVALLVLAALALVLTLPRMPYASVRLSDGAEEPMAVRLHAAQWVWDMTPASVPTGRTVRFRVTSEDVNHGFAIYDASDTIIGQVQAMPGFTNELVIRFDEPGTYFIRCLEYCGLNHHGMVGTFEVTGG